MFLLFRARFATPIRCDERQLEPEMDAVDRKIVSLLRENARRSFKDIGGHVHLSAPAVKRRVDRLERDGVIRGYTAIVDPAAFGWHTEAFVDLYCDGPHAGARRSSARWSGEPGVVSAHTVAGEASALLHVMAEDTRDLELALERIRARRGHRPDRDRGRALDAGAAMRRAYPGGPPAALDPRLLRLRGARAQRPRAAPAARCRTPGTRSRSSTSRTPPRSTATATRSPSRPTPRCSTTSSSWPP